MNDKPLIDLEFKDQEKIVNLIFFMISLFLNIKLKTSPIQHLIKCLRKNYLVKNYFYIFIFFIEIDEVDY